MVTPGPVPLLPFLILGGHEPRVDPRGPRGLSARGRREAVGSSTRVGRARAPAVARDGRLRLPGGVRPREDAPEGAARDRFRAGGRTGPARGGPGGPRRRRRLPELFPRSGSSRRRDGKRGRVPRRAAGQDDRRAHEHQPQQGRAHRPPPQRDARGRARPLAGLPGAPGGGAELPRRHGRAGRRRRRGPHEAEGRPVGRRRALRDPGRTASRRLTPPARDRLPLLGRLRRGRARLRGASGDARVARGGPPRDRGGHERDREDRGGPDRGDRLRAPRDDGQARTSRTTSFPARATSSGRTSGSAPSSA